MNINNTSDSIKIKGISMEYKRWWYIILDTTREVIDKMVTIVNGKIIDLDKYRDYPRRLR